jgi:hypothetical protein
MRPLHRHRDIYIAPKITPYNGPTFSPGLKTTVPLFISKTTAPRPATAEPLKVTTTVRCFWIGLGVCASIF